MIRNYNNRQKKRGGSSHSVIHQSDRSGNEIYSQFIISAVSFCMSVLMVEIQPIVDVVQITMIIKRDCNNFVAFFSKAQETVLITDWKWPVPIDKRIDQNGASKKKVMKTGLKLNTFLTSVSTMGGNVNLSSIITPRYLSCCTNSTGYWSLLKESRRAFPEVNTQCNWFQNVFQRVKVKVLPGQ